MPNIIALIIQLVSGAVGGVGTGKVMPKLSLGTVGNVIAGIVGGGLGGQILKLIGIDIPAGGELEIGSIIGSILGGGVGGGALMAIVSAVKGLLGKK